MKTKKILSAFLMAFVLLLTSFVLVACGNDDAVKFAKIEGLAKVAYVGEQYDTSNAKATIELESGKKIEVNAQKLTFGNLDTSSTGDKILLISYTNDDVTITYEFHVDVHEYTDDYEVYGFESPAFVDAYYRNSTKRNTYNKTGSNGQMGFTDVENPYVVGNENNFKFEPGLSVVFANGEAGVVTNYEADYKLYLIEGTNTTLLTGETLAGYVTVDATAHTLKFTQSAAGKRFKVSVLPVLEDATDLDPVIFTFRVVNGYNVYTAADLSVFDNVNALGKWTSFKQANNIPLNLSVSGLILQRDITITAQDIPAAHLYTAAEVAGDVDADRAVGSLKDFDDDELGMVYSRVLDKNEVFNFEGNYFQISAQEVPIIVRECGESPSATPRIVITHSSLFSVAGREFTEQETKSIDVVSTFNLRNIELNGNTKKTDDETLSGGIIFLKKKNCVVNVYNNVAKCWFITYFSRAEVREEAYVGHEDCVPLYIGHTNAFDNFNCFLYCSAGVVDMVGCKFIGAGGPVMICDHSAHNADGSGGIISDVRVNNCTLESWVSGREGWFSSFEGASTLAASINALNALTAQPGYDVSISNGSKINFVALYKSGKDANMSDRPIRGWFTVNGKDFKLDASKTLMKLFVDVVNSMHGFDDMATAMGTTADEIAAQLKSAISFQTYDGAFGYASTSSWALAPAMVKSICSMAIPMQVQTQMESDQVQTMINQYVEQQISLLVDGYIAENYPTFNDMTSEQQEQIRTAVDANVREQALDQVTEAVTAQVQAGVEEQVRATINAMFAGDAFTQAHGQTFEEMFGMKFDEMLDLLAEADFSDAEEYINLYLPVGMSLVLGLYEAPTVA